MSNVSQISTPLTKRKAIEEKLKKRVDELTQEGLGSIAHLALAVAALEQRVAILEEKD